MLANCFVIIFPKSGLKASFILGKSKPEEIITEAEINIPAVYEVTTTLKTSEPLDVYINNPDNPVTQLTINSKVDKEVRIEAAAISSTPEGLLGLFNTYKYLFF